MRGSIHHPILELTLSICHTLSRAMMGQAINSLLLPCLLAQHNSAKPTKQLQLSAALGAASINRRQMSRAVVHQLRPEELRVLGTQGKAGEWRFKFRLINAEITQLCIIM